MWLYVIAFPNTIHGTWRNARGLGHLTYRPTLATWWRILDSSFNNFLAFFRGHSVHSSWAWLIAQADKAKQVPPLRPLINRLYRCIQARCTVSLVESLCPKQDDLRSQKIAPGCCGRTYVRGAAVHISRLPSTQRSESVLPLSTPPVVKLVLQWQYTPIYNFLTFLIFIRYLIWLLRHHL